MSRAESTGSRVQEAVRRSRKGGGGPPEQGRIDGNAEYARSIHAPRCDAPPAADPFEPTRITTQSGRCTTLALPAVFVLVLNALAPAGQPGFLETFADDPIAAGRFIFWDSTAWPAGQPSPFQYQADTHTLWAHLDTANPTARLVAPLCRTLTEHDSFTLTAQVRIRSAGLTQYLSVLDQALGIAPISLGLMNSETGPDRVGFSSLAPSYDVVSIDYFPMLHYDPESQDWWSLILPTLSSTIFTSEPPDGQISSLAGLAAATMYPWRDGAGAECWLLQPAEDPTEPDLPRDTFLNYVLQYRAPETFSNDQGPFSCGRAVLTVSQESQPLPLNGVGAYDPGQPTKNTEYNDGDTSTIITVLYLDVPTRTQRPEFRVDQIGIFLWTDSYQNLYYPGTSSLTADIDVQYLSLSWTPSADFTGDWQVNQADLDWFEGCRTGPAIFQADPQCARADLDCDGDVDQDDFGLLQVQMGTTGPQ